MNIKLIIKNKINWFKKWTIDFYPSIIQIGITNKCNFKCIMCKRNNMSNDFLKRNKQFNLFEKEMSFEEFRDILNQFSKLKKINLTGIGENFLNKDFLKMLEYTKNKKINIEFADNFYFLDEKNANKLIDIGIDSIYASIDGATKETYEKIRIGCDFDKVIKNVKGLFYLKKKRQKKYPKIIFNYVINAYNYTEVLDFIDLISSIADGEEFSIQFTDMINFDKNQAHLCLEESVTQKIIFQAIQKAKKMGVTMGHRKRIKNNMINCQHALRPIIFPTGHVSPCCFASEGIIMENINEKSFREIWDSDNYKNLRKDIRMGRIPVLCENCEFLV